MRVAVLGQGVAAEDLKRWLPGRGHTLVAVETAEVIVAVCNGKEDIDAVPEAVRAKTVIAAAVSIALGPFQRHASACGYLFRAIAVSPFSPSEIPALLDTGQLQTA